MTSPSRCCGLCHGNIIEEDFISVGSMPSIKYEACVNSLCGCHEEKVKRVMGVDAAVEDLSGYYPISSLQESWEDEFEKVFFQDRTGEKCDGWLAADGDLIYNGKSAGYCKIANPNDVKTYIRSLLLAQKQRILDSLPEEQDMHDPWEHKVEYGPVDECDGCNTKTWNAYRTAALKIIRGI